MTERQYTHEDLQRSYRSRLDSILTARLTAENINTYAEDALNRVIGITEDAVASFQTGNSNMYANKHDLETDAFEHYGLTHIEHILDHIQGIASELSGIDDLIVNSQTTDEVYVPPSQPDHTITPGSGTYDEHEPISRLKTVLFVVSRFRGGIDIHDPEQVRVSPSSVTDSMMRRLGYTLVDIPAHNRAVLVCDEPDNITYVINTQVLAVVGYTPDSVARLSKPEIDRLIERNSAVGKRVVYDTNTYVNRVNNALWLRPTYDYNLVDTRAYNFIADSEGIQDIDRALIPDIPEGFMTVSNIAKQFNLNQETIDAVIDSVAGDLFTIIIARNGYRIGRVFSPEQQQIITQRLADLGFTDHAEN